MRKTRSEVLFQWWKWSAILLTLVFIAMVFFKGQKKPPEKKESTKFVASRPTQEVFSPEVLVAAGRQTIFGTDQPRLNSRGRMPVGKGQCAFCHIFVADQKSDRCPDLRQVEKRSHLRVKEPRYRMFSEKFRQDAEPQTGIKPHARTGGEYLIESLYCPSCYVVSGFGKEGSGDEESKMPLVKKMPMRLSDYQMIAVASYLQAMESPGDYSKVTAKEDWERYFGKKAPLPSEEPSFSLPEEKVAKTALIDDTPEEMIEKMGCFVCHKIPSVPIATIGVIGPVLALKDTAERRLKSPEYQLALKEGRVHARTPKEYVVESILHPGAFIVPGFRDRMLGDYELKFTVGGLEKLADFLLSLDESMLAEDAEAPTSTKVGSRKTSSKTD